MPIIPIAIKVAQTVIKYRRQIYSVITAQDRAIKGAFVGTRISKSARYGWRSGAAAGGLIGSLITNNAEETPGNGVQKPIQKQYPSSTPNKTRNRRTSRSGSKYAKYNYLDNKCRRAGFSKRY